MIIIRLIDLFINLNYLTYEEQFVRKLENGYRQQLDGDAESNSKQN